MVEAGRFDRRVIIEKKAAAVDDGMRAKPGGWFEHCRRWANLMPQMGVEKVAAAENAAFETLRFRLRRDSATIVIAAGTHRLLYRERPYDIQNVAEIGKDQIELIVTGRADVAGK
jgi:head-tail adaptor